MQEPEKEGREGREKRDKMKVTLVGKPDLTTKPEDKAVKGNESDGT